MRPLLRILLLLTGAGGTALAQTPTLNLSEDLVRLGISSDNMVPNQPALDSGPLLESGVQYAASHHLVRVTASAGSYYFLSASKGNAHTHVLLARVHAPLTIDLQGADLYFTHPEMEGFFLTQLSQVTLQNFSVDYLQQRYTQLLVTAVSPVRREIEFTVQAGWQTPGALAALDPLLAPSGAPPTYAYVFRQGQPLPGWTRLTVRQPFAENALTLDPGTPESALAAVRPGDAVVLNLRAGGPSILLAGAEGCTLRHIRIYSGFGGLRTTGTSACLIERVEVLPRPGTDRLISTLADGISPSQPGPDNVVRLCRCIRTCDDGFSPNTFVFGSVQVVRGARALQVRRDAVARFPLPNGSQVDFERPSDGVILGSATVAAQEPPAGGGGPTTLMLNFDRDLPAGLVGAFVYATDPGLRGGNLLLERNTVQRQGWARGISVWGLMNVTLRGNYIYHSSMAGIDLQHQLPKNDWRVPPIVNVTLVHNVIDGTNAEHDVHSRIEMAGIQAIAEPDSGAVMTTSPNQNIRVTENFIADPGRAAIWIGNTAGGAIEGNTLFNPNNDPNLASASPPFRRQELQPVVVVASSEISQENNIVDRTSRRAFVTDAGGRELAAYAPGGSIRLGAFGLGRLAAPVGSLTDADGKTWPLTLSGTSAHAVDVQVPSDAALGGAYISLKAGNVTYLGTLFIDSEDNVPAINQPTFLISASATRAPAQGGVLSFLVITPPGNSYGATATDTFATPGPTGTGTGVLTVILGRNQGPARSTTIEIAGQPFTVRQSGAAPGS